MDSVAEADRKQGLSGHKIRPRSLPQCLCPLAFRIRITIGHCLFAGGRFGTERAMKKRIPDIVSII